MATVIPIGEPVNDAERVVIAHLRDHALLPGRSFTTLKSARMASASRWTSLY